MWPEGKEGSLRSRPQLPVYVSYVNIKEIPNHLVGVLHFFEIWHNFVRKRRLFFQIIGSSGDWKTLEFFFVAAEVVFFETSELIQTKPRSGACAIWNLSLFGPRKLPQLCTSIHTVLNMRQKQQHRHSWPLWRSRGPCTDGDPSQAHLVKLGVSQGSAGAACHTPMMVGRRADRRTWPWRVGLPTGWADPRSRGLQPVQKQCGVCLLRTQSGTGVRWPASIRLRSPGREGTFYGGRVRNNNNNPIWRGSVLTGEEPPPHSGELKHALPQVGAQPNPSYHVLGRQDTTSPWSTDFGGNIHS